MFWPPVSILFFNIYFTKDLLQSVCLHILELLQHLFRRCLGGEADCYDGDEAKCEAYYQRIQAGSFAQGLSTHERDVIPDDNGQSSGDDTCYRSGEVGSLPL